MPIRSSITGGACASTGTYPKLLKGDSGSVWLMTAPRQGVIVHLSDRPQKAKHKVGYFSTKMVEDKMRPFTGEIKLTA